MRLTCVRRRCGAGWINGSLPCVIVLPLMPASAPWIDGYIEFFFCDRTVKPVVAAERKVILRDSETEGDGDFFLEGDGDVPLHAPDAVCT